MTRKEWVVWFFFSRFQIKDSIESTWGLAEVARVAWVKLSIIIENCVVLATAVQFHQVNDVCGAIWGGHFTMGLFFSHLRWILVLKILFKKIWIFFKSVFRLFILSRSTDWKQNAGGLVRKYKKTENPKLKLYLTLFNSDQVFIEKIHVLHLMCTPFIHYFCNLLNKWKEYN